MRTFLVLVGIALFAGCSDHSPIPEPVVESQRALDPPPNCDNSCGASGGGNACCISQKTCLPDQPCGDGVICLWPVPENEFTCDGTLPTDEACEELRDLLPVPPPNATKVCFKMACDPNDTNCIANRPEEQCCKF